MRRETSSPRLRRTAPRYTPQQPRTVPKWDPLRYDKLLDELAEDEIAFPVPWATPDVSLDNRPTPNPAAFLVWLSVAATVLSVLGRFVAPVLLSPQLFPLWLAATIGCAFWVATHHSPRAAVVYLLAVPAALAVESLFGLAAGPPLAKLFLLLLSLGLTACLVHAVAEHSIAWLLASPGLSPADVERLRNFWEKRFDHSALRQEGARSRAEGRVHETRFIEALLDAPAGLLVLAVVALVASSPLAPLVLGLVAPSAAGLLVLARADAPKPLAALQSVGTAISSYLAYGLRAERAPGVFRSPVGSLTTRLLLVAGVLMLLTATITAPALPGHFSEASRWLLFSTLYACLPALIFLTTTFAVLGRVLPALHRALRVRPARPGEDATTDQDAWQTIVHRLRTSEKKELREELLVGFHATEGYPVLLPAKTLQEHAHILGASGGGKTSRAVMPLAAQLIRTTREALDRNVHGAVLIMDLKGTDRYAFQAIRKEAERAGRTFRFFTNQPGKTSHAFNPLLELYELGFSRGQICDILRAALNVEHGTGYGMGHFSAVGYEWLAELLEKRPLARSIAELMRDRPPATGRGKKLEENATETISALDRLARRPEMNITERNAPTAEVFAERISLAAALREGQVLYFSLGAALEETAARLIGSLAVECLYVAATLFTERNDGEAAHHGYMFVDEFQIVAGRNFQRFLEQARGAGLHFILSNQARESLPEDLRAAVWSYPGSVDG